jgi:hypothetical protein
MYKVSYYISENETVILSKWFNTLHEATEFSNSRPTGSIREIKFYDSTNPDSPTM